MAALRPASERVGIVARATALLAAMTVALCLLAACGGGSGTNATGLKMDPCASVEASGSPAAGAVGHLVYQRVAIGPLPTRATWQAGQTLSYQWCVAPTTPAQNVGDAQEALTLTLYGPFPTSTAAQTAAAQPATLPPSLVASQPVTTDTWSATVLTSRLQLPASLVPGYYVVVAGVMLGNTTGQGSNGAIAPTSQQSQIIQVTG